ncbi:MAG: hypothetical protein KJ770_07150 [Actinobacteria bacterium]|nr:hypothetical protein [Actinomycetota bacterium]
MEKKFVSITISIIIIFLIAVAVYTSYAPNSKKQKTVAASAETSTISMSLPETTLATTAIETPSAPSTTTAIETIETTAEDISKNLPTLKIIVYEGPVIIQDSDMCYYRVEAIVTGNPYPIIKFSKDDSNGAWGKNKAQVNLKNGESYDLVVTAVNSVGAVTKHIYLTWSQ